MKLEIKELEAGYGPLKVIDGLSLDVGTGETVFIAGPNGAGKSTLLRTIARFIRPMAGSITLDGRDMLPLRPHHMVSRGFSLVPEGREILATLTVLENLMLAAPRGKSDPGRLALIYDAFPMLAERSQTPAGLLSGGQQQMLAIGRALMARAQFIAIDEPSLGLAPKVVEQVYIMLTTLQQRHGLTYLIVEQSFLRAVDLGARVAVMRGGKIVTEGNARTLHESGALETAFFGFDPRKSHQ